MKNLKLILLLVLSFGFTSVMAQKRYDQLTYPKLKAYEIPNIETFTLNNGIKFYLVQDDELPLINVHVMLRSGSLLDPADKTGLAEMTASVMRDGGSVKYPANVLNKILEDKAAHFTLGMNFTSGSANLNLLKEDFDTILPVFIDVLEHPAFPDDKIDLNRKQLKSLISRRNDNNQEIADREFSRNIYGENSVYGRLEQYQTIDNITKSDLINFHKQAFSGRNMMIGVVGDFDFKTMKKKLQKAFRNVPAGHRTNLQFPKVDYHFSQAVSLINKPDANQSVVYMGHLGGLRKNPDYAALQLMNEVLSGGFSGLLMQHVRTDLGLAYAVFGTYESNVFYPGIFYTGVLTKSSTTSEAIDAIRNEIKRLQNEPITDKRLNDVKDQFLNSLVFRYDTKSKILNQRMYYDYTGLPEDTFDKFVGNVKKVSISDIQRVAQKYLKPDQLRILVVGNGNAIGTQLNKYGTVKNIDITIPEAGS